MGFYDSNALQLRCVYGSFHSDPHLVLCPKRFLNFVAQYLHIFDTRDGDATEIGNSNNYNLDRFLFHFDFFLSVRRLYFVFHLFVAIEIIYYLDLCEENHNIADQLCMVFDSNLCSSYPKTKRSQHISFDEFLFIYLAVDYYPPSITTPLNPIHRLQSSGTHHA